MYRPASEFSKKLRKGKTQMCSIFVWWKKEGAGRVNWKKLEDVAQRGRGLSCHDKLKGKEGEHWQKIVADMVGGETKPTKKMPSMTKGSTLGSPGTVAFKEINHRNNGKREE